MFKEIFDDELDECVEQMGVVFRDRITRKKDQRGFYNDGLFVLLNHCGYDNIMYVEIARVKPMVNNILCRGLISLFDKLINEYTVLGIGMYINSPIKNIVKYMDKRYKKTYNFKSNGIVILRYEPRRRRSNWDSEIAALQKEDVQGNVKEKLS